MSATKTERASTVTTAQQRHHLDDYQIRLTGGPQLREASSTENHSRPVENPPGWYDEHREVPPYRPINTNLDRTERPLTEANPFVILFVSHMFAGVWLQSTASWAWRKTGGRLNDTFFRYRVGGET